MPSAHASTADPSTAAEAAEVLRAAAVAAQRVRIAGHGTKLGWGAPIPQPDVELRMTSLARIVAHNAGDFTAIVEPGVPFARLQAELAGEGQMVALDPPGEEATIGGIVATGDSGPLRHRYLAPRDLVIGMQLALTDGSVARAGGTVIKNVAGYDLSKLFTGSYGTLGAIAQIALRLHPRPHRTATAIGTGDDPARLAAAAAAVGSRPVEADSFDVGWDARGGAILVRLSGDTAADRVARTLPLLSGAGLETSVDEDDGALWARQRQGQRSPDGVVVRVSAAPAELERVLAAARDAGATLVGRAGLGLSWLRLDALDDATAVGRVQALREALAPAPVVVLDAPAAVRDAVDPWGPVEPVHLALLRSVKARFDPTGACAPGLFVGGI
jgi:glycolate dehydrogenase FAD-binding subunit